jgi:TRAP-type C4-dicarboxylate transport system permease small subunit
MQARGATLTKGLEYLCAALLIVIVLIVFANVVARYFFSRPLHGSDEVAQFLFLWLSYIGALAALMAGRHYSVPNVIDMLPSKARSAAATFSDLVVLAMLAVLVWYGWQLVDRLSFQTSPALDLPVYYVYFALPLTSALMALVIVAKIVGRIQGAPIFDDQQIDGPDDRP